MAILDYRTQKPQIDLKGPAGNVFCLIGIAAGYAKQLGLEWEPIKQDMISSVYEHAVQVFDSHFGDFVDLVR